MFVGQLVFLSTMSFLYIQYDFWNNNTFATNYLKLDILESIYVIKNFHNLLALRICYSSISLRLFLVCV